MLSEGAVYRIVQDTWTSTLGFQLDLDAPEELCGDGGYTVCVKITGAWDGEVRLHCPPILARLIAAAIFQVEADKAGDDEILDALSELIHIVGGNLKALLPQPVSLSLPCLLDPTNWAQTTPQWQMVCHLPLLSEGHPFAVTVLGDFPAPRNRKNPSDWEIRQPAVHP